MHENDSAAHYCQTQFRPSQVVKTLSFKKCRPTLHLGKFCHSNFVCNTLSWLEYDSKYRYDSITQLQIHLFNNRNEKQKAKKFMWHHINCSNKSIPYWCYCSHHRFQHRTSFSGCHKQPRLHPAKRYKFNHSSLITEQHNVRLCVSLNPSLG